MNEEKKKMSIGKKVLIGVGIYMAVGVVVTGIVFTLDDKKKAVQAESEAQARAELAEMDAIFASHDPQTFLSYARMAAEKQNRITVQSVQPDVYTCIVDADIGGYEYSMSDDGADADGMMSAACLFALDCSEEIFAADEHIEQITLCFRVKYKSLSGWLENAVILMIDRAEFNQFNYAEFRAKLQNDYNEIAKIARMLMFGGDVGQRLKKYKK